MKNCNPVGIKGLRNTRKTSRLDLTKLWPKEAEGHHLSRCATIGDKRRPKENDRCFLSVSLTTPPSCLSTVRCMFCVKISSTHCSPLGRVFWRLELSRMIEASAWCSLSDTIKLRLSEASLNLEFSYVPNASNECCNSTVPLDSGPQVKHIEITWPAIHLNLESIHKLQLEHSSLFALVRLPLAPVFCLYGFPKGYVIHNTAGAVPMPRHSTATLHITPPPYITSSCIIISDSTGTGIIAWSEASSLVIW